MPTEVIGQFESYTFQHVLSTEYKEKLLLKNHSSIEGQHSQRTTCNTLFPIKTHEDLLRLEVNLSKNKLYRHYFLKHFTTRIDHSKPKLQLAHAVTDYIIDCELMTKLTWAGTKRKAHESLSIPRCIPFKNLSALQRAFREIMSLAYPNYTREECIYFFKLKRFPYNKQRYMRKLKHG